MNQYNDKLSHRQAFALQNGGYCYSGRDVELNYNKYGTSTACVNGMGGYYANDVYMFGQGKAHTPLDIQPKLGY